MNLLIITFILKVFINNRIIKEKNEKEHSEAKLIMVKSIRLRQVKLIKNAKKCFNENWNFLLKNKQIKKKKKMKYQIIQSYEIKIEKLYLDDGRLMK